MSRDNHAIKSNFVDVFGKGARGRIQQGTAADRMNPIYATSTALQGEQPTQFKRRIHGGVRRIGEIVHPGSHLEARPAVARRRVSRPGPRSQGRRWQKGHAVDTDRSSFEVSCVHSSGRKRVLKQPEPDPDSVKAATTRKALRSAAPAAQHPRQMPFRRAATLSFSPLSHSAGSTNAPVAFWSVTGRTSLLPL